jgi:hypothetical protein
MEQLFKSIAANTEKQLTIVINKKKVADEDVLLVIIKQDEISPFSFKGKPDRLDAEFEELYNEACERFRNLNPSEEVTSNADAVVETEKKQQEEEKKPAVSRSTPKPAATKEEIISPLEDIKKKIGKCNKTDSKKILDITERVKKSKDPDVRDFSVKELERYMDKCKFTPEEIKLWVDESLKNSIPAPAAPTSEPGIFAGKQTEAQMVEVTEEEEEEPVEEEEAVEPEPEPVKEEKKEDKKPAAKSKPKPQPAPKPEPAATQPEDDDLLF